MVENLSAIQETQVGSVGWEDPLEKEMATHSSILLGEFHGQRSLVQSMGFSRQDYWSGLPFLSPGDLPNPGIECGSPALQTCALPSEPPLELFF